MLSITYLHHPNTKSKRTKLFPQTVFVLTFHFSSSGGKNPIRHGADPRLGFGVPPVVLKEANTLTRVTRGTLYISIWLITPSCSIGRWSFGSVAAALSDSIFSFRFFDLFSGLLQVGLTSHLPPIKAKAILKCVLIKLLLCSSG